MEKQTNVPKLRFPELLSEWELYKLANVSDFLDGRRKPIKESERSLIKGQYPYYGASGIIDYVNDFIFDEEVILLGEDGENIVSRNLPLAFKVSGKCWINNHAHVIKPKSNTDIDFLTHSLERISFVEFNTGTAQPKLNQEVCRGIKLYFPSLPEQTKIANFLTGVDGKLNQLKKKKSLLEQFKKGIMQQVFSQELRFKDENGNDFEDWKVKKLGSVANFRRGSFPQPYGLPEWYDDVNGMPFIQVYDVDDNMLLKPSTKNKISQLGAKQSVFVKKGTLVITIQGSIGRIAKTQYDAYIDRTLLIFQSYKLPIDIDYFKYVVFLLFEIEKTKAPGGTIKTITKEVLTDFTVPIPSLPEQTKIANFLNSLDDKIAQTALQIEKMQLWKKGLLQQMFV